ncbi:TRAP transporter substrate-binding protein [Tritonibacter mobilis]|uniref:TRAP transporter substrate-binding protein n=1 Tax=Tritonibacter mobilis TaxID=379347 RepID=UPI000806BE8F|nr:TRAP transporter substrate-binding protein [Tritonibacter mobilis]MCA2007738.1 TRAP transporter substrate-binding protein [Tritonibacter mobilis]GLP88314.1 C4-dicarboxylate ABC transporter substrate-binding protein [Tritonibacter mobilis]SDY05773.1 TRAP-type C4-dicarboxylate transport system, substrate-binding protein [Tritonibacter mobilis]
MNKMTLKATVASAALAVVAAGAQAEKWDMPMAYAASNYHSEMGVVFADKVRDYTGGDVDITVHAGGSLFKGGEIKRAVQTGQAPIGERLMSAHTNEEPLLGWDNLPFLATSYADNDKLWAVAKDKVNAKLAEQNLVTLYSCPWPGQGFYFKKEVNSSEDTQGVKFRSYNTATATFAEELGMIPVQVEAAELSQALATGVVDAFISSGSTGYDRKVWEQLGYYYKVNAWLPRNYVMVNKQVWDGLSADTQAAIQKAADETGAACTARSEELANWYFEQLEANGMKVVDAGPEFRTELEAIGAKMTDEWLATVGEDGQEIVDAFKAN